MEEEEEERLNCFTLVSSGECMECDGFRMVSFRDFKSFPRVLIIIDPLLSFFPFGGGVRFRRLLSLLPCFSSSSSDTKRLVFYQ